ncbi:MAG: helix-turn-helix domain-containing protein [Candidatus Anammoxibacter sp.]
MAKTYENVEELVKGLSTDNKFKDSVLQEIKSKSISKFLFALRCEHGLTQKQMSDKMDYTQSKISKIENAYDKNITVKDLLEYGNVLDLQLEIGFRKQGEVKIVDLIKYHAFKIKNYLDMLAKLAGKDATMKKGTLIFFGETLFNMLKIIQDSTSKLHIPENKEKPKVPIYISSPLQELTEGQF